MASPHPCRIFAPTNTRCPPPSPPPSPPALTLYPAHLSLPGVVLGSVALRSLPRLWADHFHGLHGRHHHLGSGDAPAHAPHGAAHGGRHAREREGLTTGLAEEGAEDR